MSKRRVVHFVVALATTATLVLALLVRSQLAIAALAIAMVSMFGWVVLWARALNARVGQIGANIERQGRRDPRRVADLGTTIGSLDERLSSTQQYVARRADAHDDKLVRLIRDLYGVRVQVQRTPSATAELDRVYRRSRRSWSVGPGVPPCGSPSRWNSAALPVGLCRSSPAPRTPTRPAPSLPSWD